MFDFTCLYCNAGCRLCKTGRWGGANSATNPNDNGGGGGKTDTTTYYALTIQADANQEAVEAKVNGVKITDLTKIKKGTVVELVATPKSGYKLKDFTGANTANGKTTVTMDGNKTVKANFERIALKCGTVRGTGVNEGDFTVKYKIGSGNETALDASGVIPLQNVTDGVVIKVEPESGVSGLKYSWKKNGSAITGDGITDTTDNITVKIEGNKDIAIELTVSK